MADKYKSIRRELHREASKEKMCEKKAAFDTYEDALQKGQRVYRCPHCEKFHRSGKMAKFLSRYK